MDRAVGGAGGTGLARAYAAIAGFLVLVDSVNVLSTLHDAARTGRSLSFWEPAVWEFTSGLSQLAVCGVILAALVVAPPGRAPWARIAAVHGVASLVFSGLHTGLMTLLRMGVYAAKGLSYRPPPFADVVYEYRKDILAYLVLGALFWLFRRPAADTSPDVPVPSPSAATVDILEGPRVHRTPVGRILAVRAAGNYVEFLLEDGRRPLMRAALAEMEVVLRPYGFLRTHRSWIVNPARLRSFEPAGSGDYRIRLDGGAEAPLSRRFPAALERLRRSTSGVAPTRPLA